MAGPHVSRARDGEGEHVLRGLQATCVSPVQAGRFPRQPQGHHHEQCLQDPQGSTRDTHESDHLKRNMKLANDAAQALGFY